MDNFIQSQNNLIQSFILNEYKNRIADYIINDEEVIRDPSHQQFKFENDSIFDKKNYLDIIS